MKISKQAYIKYRKLLQHSNVGSYVDQSGKTYTVCAECYKQDCKNRSAIPGCMAGETKPEILKIIKRG